MVIRKRRMKNKKEFRKSMKIKKKYDNKFKKNIEKILTEQQMRV